ncbi:DUF3427 domain-containing protein [Lachnobacterium bovis]|uniref:PLD-like domain-containing protein n=1 Tax=Lachnobacterium bovis TaxID=140626 RepID=A0A1H9R604_9FIRM|nr:DUF3427 domain-containing protein [Lachnobacterium bovis]SER68128.1 PLD-like domain-containing protein [Lachnobacterium bovis]
MQEYIKQEELSCKIQNGFKTAYIDGSVAADPQYVPQFVSNNYKEGRKVLTIIEDELLKCDSFKISVAFITSSGVVTLLPVLKELEEKGIKGEILTTNYLNFSEPKALKRLQKFSNITIKMYDIENARYGFHTKGYIFKKNDLYRMIIGSSNLTGKALTENLEWNTKVLSTSKGEVACDILKEFDQLWNSQYSKEFDEFYEEYERKYQIIKRQKEIAKESQITSIEEYKLQPNSMQILFINNLKKIIDNNQNRALLISATGTGKTFASAFAMRELGFKRVLFLVHRSQLAIQTKKSYKKVFSNKVKMGLFGGGHEDYDSDYIFATVQKLSKDDTMSKYNKDAFDCIILDEAHHSSANSYQKVMNYFTPKLWLGMTATPDKTTDLENIESNNIYEIFNYQIACEIRLQDAMEEKLLCPFHYFGVSDIVEVDETEIKKKKIGGEIFKNLTSESRVDYILKQANFYGYSGDRVKGLIFCSRIDEAEELSKIINQRINKETNQKYRTIALSGKATEEERQDAFERLAQDEGDNALDYILSVEILNEGVDIVEVNQVIMLRPTQSPIVFIQQLGRGLRKSQGKEYVVIIDFIGNYDNNFMIPVALSGDRSYNQDTIKKYIISGNNLLPGTSTIHFDSIAKEKIFKTIDKMKGIKNIITQSYTNLKKRLGRIPYLLDFYRENEIDPSVIIDKFGTYQDFLEKKEKELYVGKITQEEKCILKYLSKTIIQGIRPHEICILENLLKNNSIELEDLKNDFEHEYHSCLEESDYKSAISLLNGQFTKNKAEKDLYKGVIDIVKEENDSRLRRFETFSNRLQHAEFNRQLNDIVEVAKAQYNDKYFDYFKQDKPFVLFQKYTRRDVCLLTNFETDISSVMYGKKRIKDEVFLFVTYHKEEAQEGEQYVQGRPDYADAFKDSMTFYWDSQIGQGIESNYCQEVITASKINLFVKKDQNEKSFYYLGKCNIQSYEESTKLDNSGNEKAITKFVFKMNTPVREDVLKYLNAGI